MELSDIIEERLQEVMSPDEVVAYNLAKLINLLGMSQTKVAQKMGVPRHIVRDMLRTDRPQRAFSWGEMIRLCSALGVNLSHLVLPPKGVVLTDIPVLLPLDGELQLEQASDDEFHGSYTPGRSALSWALFGLDVGEKGIPSKFIRAKVKEFQKQLETMKEMFGLEEEE